MDQHEVIRQHGLVEQAQLLGLGFFALMVLDIPANNLRGHFIANGPNNIAIFPQFPALQAARNCGKMVLRALKFLNRGTTCAIE